MIELSGKKIWAGDFHTHWYWDKLNPSCYIAGMRHLDMDFILLADGKVRADKCNNAAKSINSGLEFFKAKEITYDFAHIVALLNDDTIEEEMTIKEGSPSLEDAFRLLRDKTKMLIFAHPTRNWPGAFQNNSYKPLADLYKKGLFDAVQIESPKDYQDICTASGCEVPIVMGIDCHNCLSLEPKPEVLYSKDIPVFAHINPCARFTTLVISDELTEDSLVTAVKNRKSAIFDYQTHDIIGPAEVVGFLKKNNYALAWKKKMECKNKLQVIPGNLLVGEPAKIKVVGGEVKALSFPSQTTPSWHSIISHGSALELDKVPVFNQREKEYYPLGVQLNSGETHAYALLVQEPVFAKIDWGWKEICGKYEKIIECNIYNLYEKDVDVEIICDSRFTAGAKSVKLNIPAKKEIIHRFILSNIRAPGFEYDIKVETRVVARSFISKPRVSFPACIKLKQNASPWNLHQHKIILNDIKQVKAMHKDAMQAWQGVDDISGEIALWWDEENFYLYAEITDEVFCQKWEGYETFWGDSVQFSFDPGRSRTRGYGGNYEFAIAKTAKNNELMLWYAPENGSKQVMKLIENPSLDIERNDQIMKTYYRLSIPWHQLKPFSPESGAKFNFMLCLNDNDGTVLNRKCCLYYGGNLAEVKDLQKSHEVILLGD